MRSKWIITKCFEFMVLFFLDQAFPDIMLKISKFIKVVVAQSIWLTKLIAVADVTLKTCFKVWWTRSIKMMHILCSNDWYFPCITTICTLNPSIVLMSVFLCSVFFFSLYFSPPFAKIGMRLKKAFQDDRNLSVADKSVPS